MDAVALLVNGQQVGRSQKASGGRWTRSFPPRLTVHGKDSPREGAWDTAGHGRRGYSLGLLTSSHQGCHGGSLHPGHLAQGKARAHGTRFWHWEELKYHNLKDLKP